jgi:hypothetical protein
VPFDFFHLPIATYDLRLFPCCSMPPTFLILHFLNGQLKAGGINSFQEDRNRGYFLLEDNKIIYDKAIIFFFCVFERNYFSGKFMSPSLGNPAPYPSTSAPELNNTTRFNQYRSRIPSPFIRVVFIEENKTFPGLLYSWSALKIPVIGLSTIYGIQLQFIQKGKDNSFLICIPSSFPPRADR